MWLAEVTFPSGNRFKLGMRLKTAMYFARKFGCNVLLTHTTTKLAEYCHRKEWED